MLSAYNVDYAVMNESWVRAFAIRFMEHFSQYFPKFNIKGGSQRNKEKNGLSILISL